MLGGTTGELHVVNGHLVNREDGAGGAVFRTHVANGGAGFEGERGNAGTVGLDELADDAVLTQQLGDGKNNVSRGDAFFGRTGDAQTNYGWDQHRGGLTEHGGLGFYSANTPAQNTETIDHGGVRVSADHGVEVGHTVGVEDHAGEMLQVDLVTDTHARGNDAEVPKGTLRPLQELVAFAVALVFNGDVFFVALGGAGALQDDRVVDDELDGHEGVDLFSVATEGDDCITHRREVDHGWNAGEVLHQDALGSKGNFTRVVAGGFAVAGRGLGPRGQGSDVFLGDFLAILVAEEVLQQHLDGVGELVDSELLQCFCLEGVIGQLLTIYRKGSAGAE